MGDVVSFPSRRRDLQEERRLAKMLVECDGLVRSRMIVPPLGQITFQTGHGRVRIVGDTMWFEGDDFTATVIDHCATTHGDLTSLFGMICDIHRDVELFRPTNWSESVQAPVQP